MASRHGGLFLPVARVSLAPVPHALDIALTTKVVAVGWCARPVPLTGQLAGLTAGGFAAVTLAVLVTVIGEEKLAATAALTSLGPQTHNESKTTTTQAGIKAKQTKGRRTSEEEGR